MSEKQNPAEAAVQATTIVVAAQALFDNRLGWSDGRNPYAPRAYWRQLGIALYGRSDPRVAALADSQESICDICGGSDWGRDGGFAECLVLKCGSCGTEKMVDE